MHIRRVTARASKALGILLTIAVTLISCGRAKSLDAGLAEIVKPYRFNVFRWEFTELLRRPVRAQGDASAQPAARSSSGPVTEYMTLLSDIRRLEAKIEQQSSSERDTESDGQLQALQAHRQALVPEVERILGSQIRQVLQQEGIYNPADRLVGLRVAFPPIYFRLQKPPHTLIVSPRERIESMREVMLLQDLSLENVIEIEAKVEGLGVSALVEAIGGFGATYPTFVSDDASLYWIVKTATEEWLHQYLAFTPLGFAYILDLVGVARNYDIATMNETVAGIVSAEIASRVMQAYYAEYLQPTAPPKSAEPPRVDFNAVMRDTRLQVDEMLAKGQVDEAERFMEERRQYLQANGYYIRKLNQAYFAFYGTYADMPSSVSPIGEELRQLQTKTKTLRDFLNAAAGMYRRSDLQDLLEGLVISRLDAYEPVSLSPAMGDARP